MSRNPSPPHAPGAASAKTGVLCGLAAYLWWGFAPIYFKAVAQIPALEVLAHRVAWSVLLLNGVLLVRGRWTEVVRRLKHLPTMLRLIASTALIAVNWLIFIWAVANDRLMDASLGYYINPLVNVVLGVVILRERLRRPALVSVLLAGLGVVYLAVNLGGIPWVSLVLAGTFSLYTLLRKTGDLGSLEGLAMETALLAPAAFAYLGYLQAADLGSFGTQSISVDLLLAAAGAVTAVPLLFFAAAARRLRLATVGFLQYLAPTCQFLLAVAVYGEALTTARLISFASIWTALALYSADTLLFNRFARRSAALGRGASR